jgi:hypothetical protein
MKNKNILIVSRSFYPQNSPRSFRTTELAKELARQGHVVNVLLPINLKIDIDREFENSVGIHFMYYGPLRWKVLEKSKNKLIGDWKRKFGRLLFLLFEYPNIEIYFKLPRILRELKGYDLMISIAVPHENHWAIAKVRSKDHPIAKTWVADCGDSFMLNEMETISPPFYFGWLEKKFLKKADAVVVPYNAFIETQAFDPTFQHKYKVIPQGFNFEEVDLCETVPNNDIPTFAYAGGVSVSGIRSLHNFINILKKTDIPFRFHIYSSNGQAVLKDEVKGYEEIIILHQAIQRKTLLYELSKMNFLVNLDNGSNLNSPSKLIDYGLTKRPILNINPIKPDEALVLEFLSGNYEKSFQVKDIEKYNIKDVAKAFLLIHQA